MDHKRQNESVVGFPGSDSVSNEELLELDCDILIPAALEEQITEDNAPRIKAKLIAEAANGPTTPEADRILYDRGVIVLPDIFANAGGVTVSYFEWVQGIQAFPWTEAEVNSKLKRMMVDAYVGDQRHGRAVSRSHAHRRTGSCDSARRRVHSCARHLSVIATPDNEERQRAGI